MEFSDKANAFMPQIEASLASINARIETACVAGSRRRESLTLVAATKRQPIEKLVCLIERGVVDFGENYAQELQTRQAALAAAAVRWHFIGHLQSNKIRILAQHCHAIHTLASAKHAERLDRVVEELNRPRLDVFIEVNIRNERQKSGVSFKEAEQLSAHIRSACPNLRLVGLMSIPPQDLADSANLNFVPPEYFQLAAASKDLTDAGYLSLGMSGDLEAAIIAGATHLRIGTALLGPRLPV